MKSERVASSSARCCSPKKGALADYYISKMPFQCPCCDTGSGSTLYNLWRHHDGKHSECPLGCPCHILYPRLPPPPPPMDPKMQQLLQHVLLSSVFFCFFSSFFYAASRMRRWLQSCSNLCRLWNSAKQLYWRSFLCF